MVVLPGVIGYVEYSVIPDTAVTPSVLHFAGGLGALALFLVFFIALTIMLGTFFQSRGPVLFNRRAAVCEKLPQKIPD